MGHVNNAAYLDYLEEALLGRAVRRRANAIASLPRTIRLEYLAPAAPGSTVAGEVWATDARGIRGRGRRLGLAAQRRRRRGARARPARHGGGCGGVVRRRAGASWERSMTRTVFRGGGVRRDRARRPRRPTSRSRTGGSSRSATGLDGDEAVDVAGRTLLPGLFDCHVHVMIEPRRPVAAVPARRSRTSFYEAAANLRATLADRDHHRPRRGWRRPRHQAGGRGRADRRARGCRSRSRCSARPAATATTGCRRAVRVPLIAAHPGVPSGDRRRAGRDAAQGPRARTGWAPTSSRSRPRGGVLSPRDDPAHAHFRPEELDVARRGGDGRRDLRHGPRAGRRRDQERRPGGHPLDRARDLPRRRGDRADARARAPGSCRRSSRRRA